MELKNLCCLHKCPNGLWLELANVEELIRKNETVKKDLEVDLPGGRWRYVYTDNRLQSKDWSKIGEGSRDGKFVQLIFDPADFTQLKNAFSIASHFYSNNDDCGYED